MDKGKKHIDQLFKEGLDNRSFEIPASFENDLNQRLDALEKKKKRGFFFWLIMLLGIVGFSAIALLLINTNQSPVYTMENRTAGQMESSIVSIDSVYANTSSKIQVDDLQDSKIIAQVNSSNTDFETPSLRAAKQNQVISDSEHSIINKESVSQTDKEKTSTVSNKSTENNINPPPSAKDERSTKPESNNVTQTATNKDDNTVGVEQRETKTIKQSEKSTPIVEESDKDKIEITSDKDGKDQLESISDSEKATKSNNTPSLTNEAKKEAITAKDDTKLNSEATLTETNNESQSDIISKVEPIQEDNKGTSDLTSKEEDKTISEESKTNELHQVKKNIPKWRTELQLYAGLGSTIINDKGTNENYGGLLNENRKPLNTPTFGMNANLSYRNITFGLGLSYLQTGEIYSTKVNQINFTDVPYLEYDSIEETISYYQPYGAWIEDSTILTIDSVTLFNTVSDTTLSLREIKNRYSWISVPVYFGYRFSFGKYEIIPRIGAQFNFGITNNSGQYPTSNFEDISTYNAARFNVSYLVNIELRRNFNKWSVFARPYFKSMIGPAIDESILKRKYSSWGLQLGVGFDL